MFYPMYYIDPTYILIIIGMLLCMLASARVNATFKKYDRVYNRYGMSGREAAERLLQSAGIYNIRVERVSGNLTDYYDNRNQVLCLSDSTYNSTSVAAVGVAAHECGHAIQYATGYFPIRVSHVLHPVAQFGSTIAWPLIILGLFIRGESSSFIINLGIFAFSLAVVLQFVTLPIEFNASRRALRILEGNGILQRDEIGGARKVLSAAAMTYVAALASSVLQLLRIILLFGRRNDE